MGLGLRLAKLSGVTYCSLKFSESRVPFSKTHKFTLREFEFLVISASWVLVD